MLLSEGCKWRVCLEQISARKAIEKSGEAERFLDSVKQGNNPVSDYVFRFEKNCQEIEEVDGINFSLQEKIRSFTKGLWVKIRTELPTTNIKIDRSSFRLYTESILKVEAQIKWRMNTIKDLKKDINNGKDKPKDKSNSSNATLVDQGKKRECFIWRKHGQCKYGSKCRYKEDHLPATKGIQGKKDKKKESKNESEDSDEYYDAVDVDAVDTSRDKLRTIFILDSGCSVSKTDRRDI